MGEHLLKYVTIAYNPLKEPAKHLAEDVVRFLKKKNIKVDEQRGELLITVGGDGTILHHFYKHRLPVFAIGTRTSCLTQADFTDWEERLASVLKHGYKTEKRLLLASELGGRRQTDALNDIVVRNREHRVVSISLLIANPKSDAAESCKHCAGLASLCSRRTLRERNIGKKHFSFLADGIVFATPTGSTAYCYSCGGKKLGRKSRRYQVAAIAPYRRAFRPLVLGPGAVCTVELIGRHAADLVIDGRNICPIGENEKLRVAVSKNCAEFVVVK